MEANALAGSHTINVPAGFYLLALAGVGEAAGALGDLDITGDVTIAGAGPAVTIVDAGGLERAFEIDGTARISGADDPQRSGRVAGGSRLWGELRRGPRREPRDAHAHGLRPLGGPRERRRRDLERRGGLSTVDRCTISGGEAVALGITNAEGGGLLVRSPTTITNSTISGNWSAGSRRDRRPGREPDAHERDA